MGDLRFKKVTYAKLKKSEWKHETPLHISSLSMRSDILFLCVSVCWGRLEAEPEDRIRDRCCGVPVTASFTRQHITEVSQDLGKTTALLATSNVDKAISVFQNDFAYVRQKVMKDCPGSFMDNLKNANLSKIFRKCFFKKDPFPFAFRDVSFDALNEDDLNLVILLAAGIGIFSVQANEKESYASYVAERARLGHLHLLIADSTVAHGVNFAISRIILSPSIVKDHAPSTIFQLMGRAGRLNLSNEAQIFGCEAWVSILQQGLHSGVDLFADDKKNVQAALAPLPSATLPIPPVFGVFSETEAQVHGAGAEDVSVMPNTNQETHADHPKRSAHDAKTAELLDSMEMLPEQIETGTDGTIGTALGNVFETAWAQLCSSFSLCLCCVSRKGSPSHGSWHSN